MLEIRQLNQDPPFQAGKWQQVRLLIDAEEMKALFDELGDCYLYRLGGVLPREEKNFELDDFLSMYSHYIQSLKEGKIPEKTSFSCAMTADLQALFSVLVGDDKQIIRIRQPVIQMQEHTIDYSREDHKFRSMVFGKESVTWGLQFSYPQLFTDPKTQKIINVLQADFLNTGLFRTLQKWVRKYTVPTPFIVEEKKIHVPFRLGKSCFSWIGNHPQLVSKGVTVHVS